MKEAQRFREAGETLSHGPTHLPKMAPAAAPALLEESRVLFQAIASAKFVRSADEPKVPEVPWISARCVSKASFQKYGHAANSKALKPRPFPRKRRGLLTPRGRVGATRYVASRGQWRLHQPEADFVLK